ENIIKEVDGVKTRMGDLESNLEKNGVTIKSSIDLVTPIPTTEPNTKPETSPTPKVSLATPALRPRPLQATALESLSENQIDDLLNKSLESLLMEQNIDTMMNEFFINLK
ncbi:MAG: hypothetical protein NTY91_07220, partial [Euryarchaeota archaeon]|nr:hypothetical protein [Euryarchaeota archaeon]